MVRPTSTGASSQTNAPAPSNTGLKVSSDRPIGTLAEDRYELQRHFVPRLARLSLEWPSKDGLVVGLFGSWGIGKTSILNMFRDYLQQNRAHHENVLIASFNPWFYEDTGALVTSFFATIAAELGKDNENPWRKQAATALKAMGTFLTVASKGVSLFGLTVDAAQMKAALEASKDTLKVMGEFSGGLAELADTGHKKLDQYRTSIEEALESLGKTQGRIIILIDDVDRLNKSELISLLRLVRTVADLPFITLVIAMDDERIRDVLKDAVSEGYGQGYLDKIVQVPMHVPLPEHKAITNELVSQIEITLKTRGLSLPEELTPNEYFNELSLPQELRCLTSLISTPRDLARYINGLRMLLLAGEDPDIHPTDAALIEALHIFHPNIYDRVRRHKNFLTQSFDYRLNLNRQDSNDREKTRNARTAELNSIIRGGEHHIDIKTETSAQDLIKLLFGDLRETEQSQEPREYAAMRRVRSYDYFDNYFRYAAPAGAVTRSEMDALFNLLLVHAQNEHTTGIAEALTSAFSGRTDSASTRISQDLGHRLLKVSLKLMEQIGNGVIALTERLPPETILDLMRNLLNAAINFRFEDQDDWNAETAKTLAHKLLQDTLNSPLSVVSFYTLLASSERWIEKEQQRELTANWIRRVDKELREEDPFGDAHSEGEPGFFFRVLEKISKLEEASPISSCEFRTHLVEYVVRRPQRLPIALYLSAVKHKGVHVLITPKRPHAMAITSLQEQLGDYERLRDAYAMFQKGTYNAGYLSQLIEDFGKLLSHPPGDQGKV